ncbi:MAG: twin-arginine translocase subunit TatC [Actinobacteria bacterium]|nr:MAG: twin-arginine translocase subunit TatC [Actinomycetota bacterium]
MPIAPKRMPFFGHIAELRRRLMIVASVLVVAAVGLYFVADPLFNVLVEPVRAALGDRPIIALRAFDPMMVRFKVALWGALVLTSPVTIWQVMSFFLPALRPKEQRWFLGTFIASVVLFLIGVAFCYVIILPASFAWLVGQAGSIMQFQAQATDIITVIAYFLIGFGVAFETPVVVFYLTYFGVVPYAKLRKNWRIVWIVIIVVASMITPDWSPVSMGFLSAAMIGLYELSMLLVRIMMAKKIAAQRAADAEFDDDDEDDES